MSKFHYHGRALIGAAGWQLLADTPTLIDCHASSEVDSASIAAIATSESIRFLNITIASSEPVTVGRLGESRTLEHLSVWWQAADLDEFAYLLTCRSLRTLRLRGDFGAEHLDLIASAPNLLSLALIAPVGEEDKRRFEARRPDMAVTWLR